METRLVSSVSWSSQDSIIDNKPKQYKQSREDKMNNNESSTPNPQEIFQKSFAVHDACLDTPARYLELIAFLERCAEFNAITYWRSYGAFIWAVTDEKQYSAISVELSFPDNSFPRWEFDENGKIAFSNADCEFGRKSRPGDYDRNERNWTLLYYATISGSCLIKDPQDKCQWN